MRWESSSVTLWLESYNSLIEETVRLFSHRVSTREEAWSHFLSLANFVVQLVWETLGRWRDDKSLRKGLRLPHQPPALDPRGNETAHVALDFLFCCYKRDFPAFEILVSVCFSMFGSDRRVELVTGTLWTFRSYPRSSHRRNGGHLLYYHHPVVIS
jgi:hypothetical protein